jgi:hypothetical protein
MSFPQLCLPSGRGKSGHPPHQGLGINLPPMFCLMQYCEHMPKLLSSWEGSHDIMSGRGGNTHRFALSVQEKHPSHCPECSGEYFLSADFLSIPAAGSAIHSWCCRGRAVAPTTPALLLVALDLLIYRAPGQVSHMGRCLLPIKSHRFHLAGDTAASPDGSQSHKHWLSKLTRNRDIHILGSFAGTPSLSFCIKRIKSNPRGHLASPNHPPECPAVLGISSYIVPWAEMVWTVARVTRCHCFALGE